MIIPFISILERETNTVIYRDHELANKFYVIPDRWRVAEDNDGNPMMSYLFLIRSKEAADASGDQELQKGQLVCSVDLSVPPRNLAIIKAYLKEALQDEHSEFNTLYYQLTKKRWTWPSSEEMPEPQIAYPTYKSGSVELQILRGFGDSFVKSVSSVVEPSLIGANSAALFATFGAEGAQLMIQALEAGYATENGNGEEVAVPLQANVIGNCTLFGICPSLDVKVEARSADLYTFLEREWESYSKGYQQNQATQTRNTYGIPVSEAAGTRRTPVSISKTEIREITRKAIENGLVHIEMTDFSDISTTTAEAKEIEGQLKMKFLDLINETIIPSFFENAPVEEELESEQEEETDGLRRRDHRIRRQVQVFHFRKNIDVTKVKNLQLHFRQNRAFEFKINPQGTLNALLTPEEMEGVVKRIDLSQMEAVPLIVNLSTNADYDGDNIYGIRALVEYKERDARTGMLRQNSKEYLFRSNEDAYRFGVTMARNEEGELVDTYSVKADIIYKNRAEGPPTIYLKGVKGGQCVLSYGNMGFIAVKVTAGQADWDIVKEIAIDFEFPAEPEKVDARKRVVLSAESLTGSWNCYTYGHEHKKYRYQVTYYYRDDKEEAMDIVEDVREHLSINDNLKGRVVANYDLILDTNTANSAKLEIIYDDGLGNKEEYNSPWFTEPIASWNWAIPKREGAKEAFSWRYIVNWKDGLATASEWFTAQNGDDMPPVILRRYEIPLMIDAGAIPWDKWPIVVVIARFRDDTHNYFKQETIRMGRDGSFQTFKALAFKVKDNSFEYDVVYASQNGSHQLSNQRLNGNYLIVPIPEI